MNCQLCREILSYSYPTARSRDKQYIMILNSLLAYLKIDKDPRIRGIVMYKLTHCDLDVLATLEHLKNHEEEIITPIRSDFILTTHNSYFQNLTILIHLAVYFFYDYCTVSPREANSFLDEYSNGECTQLPDFQRLDKCSFTFKTSNKWYHSQ